VTHSRPSRALRTRVGLGLAALCLAGPTVQAAAAEDGVALPASPELADQAIDAGLETVSVSTAELTAPATTITLPPAVVTEEVSAAPVVPPSDPPPAPEAPPPAPEVVTEAPTLTETSSEPVANDPTAQDAAPAAASEAPAPTEPVSPEPTPDPAAATQAQPVNVNVSIRIDSPGDNGAVEQENAAVIATGAPPAAPTPEQYQPAPAQYQPPQAPPQPSAATPASPAPAAPEAGWTWTWTCGGSATDVLPAGGSASYLPENWTWNWNWNCGDGGTQSANNDPENIGQYHPGVTQYQPVNINISIRIGSPGNNGPVTQTNVAIVVLTPPAITVPALPLPVSILPSAGSDDGGTTAAATATWSEPMLELAAVELSVFADAADAVEWIFRGPSAPFGADATALPADRVSVVVQSLEKAALSERTYRPSSSALALRAVAVVHAQESVRPDRPARSKSPRKPSRRPAPPMRAPVLASGFAGASPGGTDGGGWPLLALLLVPFSLALVDSARRVGREATLPAAADLRTRRDRPG
jgi:hypothetical protein